MSALRPRSGSQQAQELQVWEQAPGPCEQPYLPRHREGSGACLTHQPPHVCPCVTNHLYSFSGLLESDKPGPRLIDSHAQANGGAKVVRIAGPADNLSGAGTAHVQGARDILQGRQARALVLCDLAVMHPGVGRASRIPVYHIGTQMPSLLAMHLSNNSANTDLKWPFPETTAFSPTICRVLSGLPSFDGRRYSIVAIFTAIEQVNPYAGTIWHFFDSRPGL